MWTHGKIFWSVEAYFKSNQICFIEKNQILFKFCLRGLFHTLLQNRRFLNHILWKFKLMAFFRPVIQESPILLFEACVITYKTKNHSWITSSVLAQKFFLRKEFVIRKSLSERCLTLIECSIIFISNNKYIRIHFQSILDGFWCTSHLCYVRICRFSGYLGQPHKSINLPMLNDCLVSITH